MSGGPIKHAHQHREDGPDPLVIPETPEQQVYYAMRQTGQLLDIPSNTITNLPLDGASELYGDDYFEFASGGIKVLEGAVYIISAYAEWHGNPNWFAGVDSVFASWVGASESNALTSGYRQQTVQYGFGVRNNQFCVAHWIPVNSIMKLYVRQISAGAQDLSHGHLRLTRVGPTDTSP